MDIHLITKDPISLISEEVYNFSSAVQKEGGTVSFVPYPETPVQFASPAAFLSISVDPQTLRLIFEYAGALIGIYKSTSYAGEFFKAALNKIGESAGARFVELLGKLWKRMAARVLENRDSRLYFSLEFKEVDGKGLEVENAIHGTYSSYFSAEDAELAFNVMIFRVLPLVNEFTIKAKESEVLLTTKKAHFFYAREPKEGVWMLSLQPIGTFIADMTGIVRPSEDDLLRYFNGHPLVRQRISKTGMTTEDVSFIIHRFQNGTTKS